MLAAPQNKIQRRINTLRRKTKVIWAACRSAQLCVERWIRNRRAGSFCLPAEPVVVREPSPPKVRGKEKTTELRATRACLLLKRVRRKSTKVARQIKKSKKQKKNNIQYSPYRLAQLDIRGPPSSRRLPFQHAKIVFRVFSSSRLSEGGGFRPRPSGSGLASPDKKKYAVEIASKAGTNLAGGTRVTETSAHPGGPARYSPG